MHELTIDDALVPMQALASRLWSPQSRHHPGQLAWSARYAEPQLLDHGPVAVVHGHDGLDAVDAWAWLESADWLELCVDPRRPELVGELLAWASERAGAPLTTSVLETEQHLVDGLAAAGYVETDTPWFTHHTLDLGRLATPSVPAGYRLHAVRPGEAEARAAVHRAAWSATSRVTTAAYERLMATAPYRPDLDLVVEHEDDGWVASCLAWLDPTTGVALLEPVGCVTGHRRRGLAGAVSLAALAAARDAGATLGLVCPRGDDDYPAPGLVYRGLGFRPGPRTRTFAGQRLSTP
jgi:predicted N-acetyltransferase YhbS